ncbi:hypothetical protein [Mesonia aquimarina]|uniref:hypothetical protein n=1 Tax=Mesonia aquimarina TaxID=1504967 RepID=UPI000EF5D269|nr:hypothetical protein [Mesonia aquimarina]
MKISKTNIQEKLSNLKNKQVAEKEILDDVFKILKEDTLIEESIIESLGEESAAIKNDFNFELLETAHIYHLDHIKEICIQYRLRFLDSHLFKHEIPIEAIYKIKHLQKTHNLNLRGFKIMAPSKAFKLKNADDPLLFAPIGNGYFYLIHKWGNDLHPFRKFKMWWFKSLENFLLLLFIMSFAITALLPSNLFTKDQSGAEFLMIAFFMFKWIGGMAIFYGFKKGKNFNTSIWNSTYFNA